MKVIILCLLLILPFYKIQATELDHAVGGYFITKFFVETLKLDPWSSALLLNTMGVIKEMIDSPGQFNDILNMNMGMVAAYTVRFSDYTDISIGLNFNGDVTLDFKKGLEI